MMLVSGSHWRSSCDAPEAGWRMMIASVPIASRVAAVSLSDSPFFTDDEEADRLITSALIHFPAVSKEDLVRVEFS